MAGTITQSQLTARPSAALRFAVAAPEDDSAIRRLLRENPIPGQISVSFEREPDYFRSANFAGAQDQTILAVKDGRLLCVGHCSTRERYLNGRVCRVDYLSDLRLDSAVRGRFDILRRGYRFFRDLQRDEPADFYFTSITADNARSIRFLERGLPGMPLYRRLGGFVTLLIPVSCRRTVLERRAGRSTARLQAQGIQVVSGSDIGVRQLSEFLDSQARRCHLALRWDEEKLLSLRQCGLALSDFQILMDANGIIACIALWDQRSFRQTVIRGYSPRLSISRPVINAGAALFGRPPLPAVGSVLAHAFLSPLAVVPGRESFLPELMEISLLAAAHRSLDYLTLGFSSDDARLPALRHRFRCREYKSVLFQVCWSGEDSRNLGKDLFFPEVAFL